MIEVGVNAQGNRFVKAKRQDQDGKTDVDLPQTGEKGKMLQLVCIAFRCVRDAEIDFEDPPQNLTKLPCDRKARPNTKTTSTLFKGWL